MLWTELHNVVTRDGHSLRGVEVRTWLEDREVIRRGGGAVVKIDTNANPRVTLRTREEVEAWLREIQLCTVVELTPLAGGRAQRAAARGAGALNRNDQQLRVDFISASNSQIVQRLDLEQGQRARVAVRVSPAPKRAQVSLELAFIGAKIRSRAAIRSVRDSTTGYRYLSRVRVTENNDGLRTPLVELNRTMLTQAYATRRKWAPSLRIREFTLMGLEPGTELLQACLIGPTGKAHSVAVLEIVVSRAPAELGALRVVPINAVDGFVGNDPEFERIHAASGRRGAEVRVGICDSGIYDDSATNGTHSYLANHWIAGKYFDAAGEDRDRPTKPDPNHARHVLDESPSMHGTNVAGQAAWGSAGIKLVDVMVQRGQETGPMNDETAERAFRWARDQGVSVVNCSKVMPFRLPQTNALVSDPGTVDQVLFLATGGNRRVSFPLNNTTADLALPGEVNPPSLPTSLRNTLWVGGCKADRTKHEARGYGPAIEVMVPSEQQPLYSPAPLREAYRAQKIEKFRSDVLAELARRDLAIVNPPARIAGKLSVVKNMRLKQLEKQAAAAGGEGNLPPRDQQALVNLRAERDDAPNPDYEKKQAYHNLHTEIAGWPDADLLAWANQLLTVANDLAGDADAQQSNTPCVRAIQGQARTEVYQYLQGEIRIRNIISHRDALAAVRQDGGHIGTDEGVSFGLPVVANLAAKLKLINRNLTANQLKRIIIDTSDLDPGFETECIARGMINPLRAYLAAYDNEVSVGGQLHHDYQPTISVIPEPRRVYYSFFYMDPEGRALYDAIRQRLVDSYAPMNIDLIEAEPPIAIPNESLTYVEGPAIQRHSWTKVVPVEEHPLVYPGRQLRLVLVNETALVIGNPIAGTLEEHAITKAADIWTPEPNAAHKVTISQVRIDPAGHGHPPVWSCVLEIPNTPDLARFTFVDRVDHLVTSFQAFQGGGVMPIAAAGPLEQRIQVDRISNRRARITVIDPALNQQIAAVGDRVTLSLGVVQRIGGARKGRNIFVNNKYHGGPTGTPAAHSSALVLFQHEIAHALGMVNPVGHAHYYNREFGGEGDHCAYNTDVRTNDEAPNFGVIGDGASGSVKVPVSVIDARRRDRVPCVMYHTRSPAHSSSVFCPECIRHLRDVIDPATWRWNSDR